MGTRESATHCQWRWAKVRGGEFPIEGGQREAPGEEQPDEQGRDEQGDGEPFPFRRDESNLAR